MGFLDGLLYCRKHLVSKPIEAAGILLGLGVGNRCSLFVKQRRFTQTALSNCRLKQLANLLRPFQCFLIKRPVVAFAAVQRKGSIRLLRQLHQRGSLVRQRCHTGITFGYMVTDRLNSRKHLGQTLLVVLVDLGNTGNLLLNPVGLIPNLIQLAANALYRCQPVFHGFRQRFNAGHNLGCVILDFVEGVRHFTGGLGSAPGQLPDFISHHRKPAALFTGAGRLNSGIQCQKISLLGDTLNGGRHALDLAGFFVQGLNQPEVLFRLLMHQAHIFNGRHQ